jgi:hypothetical protein
MAEYMSGSRTISIKPIPDYTTVSIQPLSALECGTGLPDSSAPSRSVLDRDIHVRSQSARSVFSRSISIEHTQAQFEGLVPLQSISIGASEYIINSSTTTTLTELHPVLSERTIHAVPPLPDVEPTIHGVTMVSISQNEERLTQVIDCHGDRSGELDPEIHNDLKAAVSDLGSTSGSDSE